MREKKFGFVQIPQSPLGGQKGHIKALSSRKKKKKTKSSMKWALPFSQGQLTAYRKEPGKKVKKRKKHNILMWCIPIQKINDSHPRNTNKISKRTDTTFNVISYSRISLSLNMRKREIISAPSFQRDTGRHLSVVPKNTNCGQEAGVHQAHSTGHYCL